MEKLFCREFWKAALVRAWHAVWQAAVPLIPVSTAITHLDWLMILEISLSAGLLSLIKSFATGVPECAGEGATITETPEIEGEEIIETADEDAEYKGNFTPQIESEAVEGGE